MYFVVDLWRNVALKPAQLGPRFEQHVQDVLRRDVEGQRLGPWGYVVCVVRVLSRARPRVQDGSGNIICPVNYQAVVYQPLKGEVVDGIVSSVNAVGFFAQCGPLKTFVSKTNFPADYELKEGIWTDGESPLAPTTQVRLRILGFKCGPEGMTAVGQIDQDFLGAI